MSKLKDLNTRYCVDQVGMDVSTSTDDCQRYPLVVSDGGKETVLFLNVKEHDGGITLEFDSMYMQSDKLLNIQKEYAVALWEEIFDSAYDNNPILLGDKTKKRFVPAVPKQLGGGGSQDYENYKYSGCGSPMSGSGIGGDVKVSGKIITTSDYLVLNQDE